MSIFFSKEKKFPNPKSCQTATGRLAMCETHTGQNVIKTQGLASVFLLTVTSSHGHRKQPLQWK